MEKMSTVLPRIWLATPPLLPTVVLAVAVFSKPARAPARLPTCTLPLPWTTVPASVVVAVAWVVAVRKAPPAALTGSCSSRLNWRWASARLTVGGLGELTSSSITAEVSAEDRSTTSRPMTSDSVAVRVAWAWRVAPSASKVVASTDTSPPARPLSAWASKRLPLFKVMVDARSVRWPESPCEGAVRWLSVATLARLRVEMVTLSPTVMLLLAISVKSAPSVYWLVATTSMSLGSISTEPRWPWVAPAFRAPPSSRTVLRAENSICPPLPDTCPPRADNSAPAASVAVSCAMT